MADMISKIKVLEELAKLGGEDEVFLRAIDKLTRYKRDKLQDDLKDIEAQIQYFEEEYGMKSHDFVLKFEKGDVGDRIDFMEWASLCDMRERIMNRLNLLEGA
ncbi:MAG TPA: hypothetical protein PL168_05995 [Methanobacterium sp.]|jgi:hypothetical protein|nr:hypothetical protein [Methanobacterium sp.]HOI40264.1 hypothetical protein [Methanobacterium sp.]